MRAASQYTGRMGLEQYSRVLWYVTEKPRTHEEVADLMGRGRQSIREILWRMEHLGIVHVVAWKEPQKVRGILCAVFGAGAGVSVPYPRELRRPVPGSTLARNNPKPELISFASIVRCLRDGCTRAEIFEKTGVMHHRISPLLRTMRGLGLVHTSGWIARDDFAGKPAEVVTLGAGKDVPRPIPLTDKEKQARYRERKRSKLATMRVVEAIRGNARIVANGPQSYHLLGKAAA